MNKENKKAAQERRAAEREKKARRNKLLNVLAFWGPFVAIVAVIALLVWAVATSDYTGTSDTETETEDTTTDTTADDSEETTEDSSSTYLSDDTSLIAEEGDTLNIDFTGYIDGVAFDNGSGTSDIELSENSGFIDGFADAIVGHYVGETFDIEVTFPDDYYEDLAGKDATFTITINGKYVTE